MPRRCGRPARSAVVTVTAAARRPWSPPRRTGLTAFPAAEADAASFDTGLVQRYGAALGAEQIGKGTTWPCPRPSTSSACPTGTGPRRLLARTLIL